jgi:hypothetical protein
MKCILVTVFVVEYADCKNMQGMNNIKLAMSVCLSVGLVTVKDLF